MSVEIQHRCAVLFIDIAGSTALIARQGEAAAGNSLRTLLEGLTQLVGHYSGSVIKSDGDDLVCVFPHGENTAANAARTAVEAQRLARDKGLKLYAGLHSGDVEFREVLGRRDIFGLTVNAAARLHKLVEDAPGFILLTAETADLLPDDLRERLGRFGTRNLKGIGTFDVLTLDWNEDTTVAPTSFASLRAPEHLLDLELRHGERIFKLKPGEPEALIGRAKESLIRIDDPRNLASSRHAKLHWKDGAWTLKDISRNGTFVRFAGTGDTLLLRGDHCLLQRDGDLCLGRPFEEDAERLFTLRFRLGRA
jgi:class 3 adenylate cyclase